MPDQLPLDLESRYSPREDVGAPYQKSSDTSKAAAKRVASKTDDDRAKVQLWIMRAKEHGRTWDETWEACGLSPTSNGRITELVESGQVVDSGMRRKTRSGATATVWVDVAYAPKERV